MESAVIGCLRGGIIAPVGPASAHQFAPEFREVGPAVRRPVHLAAVAFPAFAFAWLRFLRVI